MSKRYQVKKFIKQGEVPCFIEGFAGDVYCTNLDDANRIAEAMELLRDIEHIRDKLVEFRPDLVERLRAIVH